ncbi:MAG: hypothetical protein LN413_04670 [Candidatus Thermoplasmatota archaeon]|nr:hypothetical protein [Candidatus Thermoplasmatota archaeon]
MVFGILAQLPLATFVVWASIGFFQLYRRRIRTLTEVAFVVGSFSWAGYALSDWIFFGASEMAAAFILARISFSFVTMAAFLFFLFTKLFLTRPHRIDALLALPFLGALGLVWGGMVVGVEGGFPWGWSAILHPELFLLWLVYVITFASAGIWYTYRTYLVVRQNSQFLGRGMLGILNSYLAALVLGFGTNAVYLMAGLDLMPMFSTTLILPGIVSLYVLVPVTRDRISSVMRRWKSTRYTVMGGYLIYENGTLIASRTNFQDKTVDDDIFGATLDAIQTFMRTSFPALLGKSLRRIEHGDVKILVERGRYCYLATIIEGEDTDTLWITMKEAVERFERTNEPVLPDWSGLLQDLEDVEATLEDLFAGKAVFA